MAEIRSNATEEAININNILTAVARPNDHVIEGIASAESGVHPDAQKILDIYNQAPPMSSFTPQEVREIRRERGNPFDYDDVDDVDDVLKTDIEIPNPNAGTNHGLRARIYRPKSLSGSCAPALVYFHGGGFVLGDIESYDKFLARLCAVSNVVIISVEYRLAPESPFPGPVEDARTAFNWLYANAGNLELDAERFAIGGDSAGGNLAAVVCMMNRDAGAPLPLLQLLLYPSTVANEMTASRRAFPEKLLLTQDAIDWFHGHYASGEEVNDPRFNIMRAKDFSNLPAAFVMTCGFDPLRDEGYEFAQKLKASGVPVRHSCYSDMMHAFMNFGVLGQAQNGVKECAEILSGILKFPSQCEGRKGHDA